MKRYIKQSFDINSDWYDSDEVNELLVNCNPYERKVFGKLRNSSDPVVYLNGIVDATNLLGCRVSNAFIDLINIALTNVKSTNLNSTTSIKAGKTSEGEEVDWIVDYPIKDDPDYNKKRIKREIADEEDYYDLTHREGKYSEVKASDDILPFKEIQEGMKWSVDGHDYEVIKVVPHFTCTVTEDWIAEDSYKPCHEILKCKIGVDDAEEYIYIPGNAYWRLYSTGALNFPYDVYLAQSKGNDDEYVDDLPYGYDSYNDDYTPSATHGDYSPSNPWDAPGMSVRDFI